VTLPVYVACNCEGGWDPETGGICTACGGTEERAVCRVCLEGDPVHDGVCTECDGSVCIDCADQAL
jgi:hypothetical protein